MNSAKYIPVVLWMITCLAADYLSAQPWSPGADIAGSDAIHMDDATFQAWAVSCAIVRGTGLITHPDSIEVTHGDSADATGKANYRVVSLGDAGIATLSFEHPVTNGEGPDFAIFENSFDGTFLELGFVEVSSDGETFVRFPSLSETQTETQIGAFGLLQPEDLQNLAGKYMSGWGTPFDLDDLTDSNGIDLQSITTVRIIDVIGILDDSLGSKDAIGRLINDPFPSPFESCGFDLDAVGVINQSLTGSNPLQFDGGLKIYPIPCDAELFIEDTDGKHNQWELFDLQGRIVRKGKIHGLRESINLSDIVQGSYFLRCSGNYESNVTQIYKSGR